jgi:uncharacterized CHY-type Zn-finger protein
MKRQRASTGRFRCDECHRVKDLQKDGGADCGGSHFFCFDCLDKLETREAIIQDRYDRKKHVVLSGAVIQFLAANIQ